MQNLVRAPNRSLLSRDWVFGIVLLAATLAVFQPAWNGGFLWDDDATITAPSLRSVDGLARIWTQLGATQQYYPLFHSFAWVEYHLWGESTTGYHFVNILLHVLSSLILLKILQRLGIPGARLAAAIFALHPVQVESVAWITELKNTLSGVFFFGGALAYLHFAEERKSRWYALALGMFILGLAAKTAIVPFPAVMLVVLWWRQGCLSLRRDVVPLIPFCIAGIGFGLITMQIEHHNIGGEARYFAIPAIMRCVIAGREAWFYLGKLLWPSPLYFIFPRWSVDRIEWWQYFCPAALLFLGVCLWAMRRRIRAPLAAYLYYVIMLVPVSALFNQFGFRFSFVADHWLYLAMVGPVTLAAALADRVFKLLKGRGRVAARAAVWILVGVLAILSWNHSCVYADAETLYRSVLKGNDSCWMAQNNLGIILQQSNRTGEAIPHFRAALDVYPDFAPAQYNLANALRQTGETDEAIVHYRKALEIHPDDAKSHFKLGDALMQMGRNNEGIAEYRLALAFNPGLTGVHYSLGCALMLTGQVQEAGFELRKAVDDDPRNFDIIKALRAVYIKGGQPGEAIEMDRRALELAREEGQESLAADIEADISKLSQAPPQ